MIFNWNSLRTRIGNLADNFQRAVHSSDGPSLSELSHEDFMNQFQFENWSGLERWQKIDVLQEHENRLAALDGREPAKVSFFANEEGNNGVYFGGSNSIRIGESALDSPSMSFFALEHEDEHAHQNEWLKTPDAEGEDNFSKTMMRAEQFSDQQGGYPNYVDAKGPDREFYNTQSSELDSNNKAARALFENEEYFRDDPTYSDTINTLNDTFSETNGVLETNSLQRDALQENQLGNALENQAITEEEYKDALEKINDPHGYEDDLALESREIGQTLQEKQSEIKDEETSLTEENEERPQIEQGVQTVEEPGIAQGQQTDEESQGLNTDLNAEEPESEETVNHKFRPIETEGEEDSGEDEGPVRSKVLRQGSVDEENQEENEAPKEIQEETPSMGNMGHAAENVGEAAEDMGENADDAYYYGAGLGM